MAVRVRRTCRMIQRKAAVDDVIMTQAKGVETKGSDAIIPEKEDGIIHWLLNFPELRVLELPTRQWLMIRGCKRYPDVCGQIIRVDVIIRHSCPAAFPKTCYCKWYFKKLPSSFFFSSLHKLYIRSDEINSPTVHHHSCLRHSCCTRSVDVEKSVYMERERGDDRKRKVSC